METEVYGAHGTKKDQMPTDATDTKPPEEARPDTTATQLHVLVEDGKLLSPALKFTAERFLRWLEDLADSESDSADA